MDQIEILEAYVPARVEYLANLYVWLRSQMYSAPKPLLQGFSIYEVNGAFRGNATVYEERTVIVRVIFSVPPNMDDADQRLYERRVGELSVELVQITENREEEIWLVRIPANRTVIKGQQS